MLKLLFEYYTDSFSLLENPMNNLILMSIIGAISFACAWKAVNKLYTYDMIDGSLMGKIFHWIIRAIAFTIICLVVATMIRLYKWVIGVPVYIWVLSAITIVGIIILFIVIKQRMNKKEK